VDSEIKVKYNFLTRQHDHTQKVGLMHVWMSGAQAAPLLRRGGSVGGDGSRGGWCGGGCGGPFTKQKVPQARH